MVSVMMKHENDGYEYIQVGGHQVAFYNGPYYRQGYWNARPHFVKADGSSHLFHFRDSYGGTGYWHLDPGDQWAYARPGENDWYDGGYFFSSTDFDYSQDFAHSNYLEMYYVEISMSIVVGNDYVDIEQSEVELPPTIDPVEACAYTDGAIQEDFEDYLTVEGHGDDFYNGRYEYAGHWNCRPHFTNEDGAHLFHFSAAGEYWHFDSRDQSTEASPGGNDWYDGGYWVSETGYQYLWDLNGRTYVSGADVEVLIWLNSESDGYEYASVSGHSTAVYNGDYYRHGYWNGKPHWAKEDNSAHLYYFSWVGENREGYWQLDTTNQWYEFIPGGVDLYEGGYWFSDSYYSYTVDFDNADVTAQGG